MISYPLPLNLLVTAIVAAEFTSLTLNLSTLARTLEQQQANAPHNEAELKLLPMAIAPAPVIN